MDVVVKIVVKIVAKVVGRFIINFRNKIRYNEPSDSRLGSNIDYIIKKS